MSVSDPIPGDFDREEPRSSGFDVTFSGVVAGSHDFVINALVDGGIVATETDSIVVGDGSGDPDPDPGPVPIPLSARLPLPLGAPGGPGLVTRHRGT